MRATYGQSEFYDGEKGKHYFARQNANAPLAAKINARNFSQHIRGDDIVLDFGCGGGWLLQELDASKKIGVEINPVARDMCKSNGIDVYPTLAAVAENSITRVVSNHCLEHVPYPIEALRSLRAKLRNDGLLIMMLPLDDWRNQRGYYKGDPDHHLHTWTPLLLGNTFEEAGFEVVSIRVRTHAWPPGWQRLWRMFPTTVFDAACRIWSIARKRRELFAIARPRTTTQEDSGF